MKHDRIVRVVAPGLPPHPKLMFAPGKRWASVSARHPTWQSEEWAIYTTEVIIWTAIAAMLWFCWNSLPFANPVLCLLLVIVAYGVSLPIARFSLRASLRPFLARQVYSCRTTLRFSPRAIVLHSRLYRKPVVIWRTWRGEPVKVRFVVHQDRDAMAGLGGVSPQRKLPTDHLRDSWVVEVVLSTVHRNRSTDFDRQGAVLRSLPITEADSRFATRLTMVYAAAVTLTAPRQKLGSHSPSDGADIDVA